MQSKGADIDIVTGKPVELKRKADEEEREGKEQEILKRQAELAGLIHSDAGKFLIELVSERLQTRIEHLVGADPEATAYVNVLKEMAITDRLGRKAMQKIVATQMGQAKQ